MSGARTVYLLRHGPCGSGDSAEGAPLGWSVVPPAAEAWACWGEEVRPALLDLELDWVWSSDLPRCRDLARDLSREGVPLTLRRELREQSFGGWEGQPWSALGENHPLWQDPVGTQAPEGESYRDVAERVARCISTVPAGQGLILGHAGSLRACLARWLDLALPRSLDLAWDLFGLTRVDLYTDPGELTRGILRSHNLPLSSRT